MNEKHPYPELKILQRDEQIEDGEFLGVDKFESSNNEIKISIPIEYQDKAQSMSESIGVEKEQIYERWIVRGIAHEDMHWICHSLGIEDTHGLCDYEDSLVPKGQGGIV